MQSILSRCALMLQGTSNVQLLNAVEEAELGNFKPILQYRGLRKPKVSHPKVSKLVVWIQDGVISHIE